jgi:hypothetical protein
MISFTRADLDRFLSEDDGKPVVMLNLVRFRPDGGRERYLEYLNMAGPLVSRYGAEIVYAGDGATPLAAEPGQAWDAIALVRHRSGSVPDPAGLRGHDCRPGLPVCRPRPHVGVGRGGPTARPQHVRVMSSSGHADAHKGPDWTLVSILSLAAPSAAELGR